MAWKVRKEKSVRTAFFDTFSLQESGAGILRADSHHNCDCIGGSLKRGVGLLPMRNANGDTVLLSLSSTEIDTVVDTAVNSDAIIEDTPMIYVTGEDGGLYRVDPSSGKTLKRTTIGRSRGAAHFSFKNEKGRICNIFVGESAATCSVNGNSFTAVWNSGRIIDGCLIGDRLFIATTSEKICYSAPMDPANFSGSADEGGELFLPLNGGELTGLAEESGYGYIFTEKAVYRLNASASARNFRLEKLPYDGGLICPRSMATRGKGIIFLSASGAYRVHGERVERICEYLPLSPAVEACRVGYCEDILLIEFKNREGTAQVTRRLAVYADGTNGFFGDLYGTLGGTELCCVAGMLYAFTKDAPSVAHQIAPHFQTGALDLGTSKVKRLKRLKMQGTGRVRCVLSHGDIAHEYTLDLSDGEAAIRLCERGKSFALRLYPQSAAEIRSLAIEYVRAE